ncbi:hypothetical protein ABG768_006988 [Culter alburnus]|uniref:MABP domain-containing protein n=1 Tax=Culter alburnus TaxID=194366 RepID=A0AAW1ZTX2_CULAL
MADGQPITKLEISNSKDDEITFGAQGYKLVNVNLNEGTGGNQVLLWYKKECGKRPVTRIEFSFTDRMKSGLADAGYTLVDKNLNAGVPNADYISLWYFYGSTKYDMPIVDLEVTIDANEEPALLKDGWERLGCDLNRNAGGNFIYLWVKREKTSYIHEITATVDFTSDKNMFNMGYTRAGEDTNRGAGGKYVFLWYRRTTEEKQALTALDVSTSLQEESKLQKEEYKKISINLNNGTCGKDVFLWHKKEGCESQIQAIALLINSKACSEYQKAGCNFINRNLNEGNKGCKINIAYK